MVPSLPVPVLELSSTEGETAAPLQAQPRLFHQAGPLLVPRGRQELCSRGTRSKANLTVTG